MSATSARICKHLLTWNPSKLRVVHIDDIVWICSGCGHVERKQTEEDNLTHSQFTSITALLTAGTCAINACTSLAIGLDKLMCQADYTAWLQVFRRLISCCSPDASSLATQSSSKVCILLREEILVCVPLS